MRHLFQIVLLALPIFLVGQALPTQAQETPRDAASSRVPEIPTIPPRPAPSGARTPDSPAVASPQPVVYRVDAPCVRAGTIFNVAGANLPLLPGTSGVFTVLVGGGRFVTLEVLASNSNAIRLRVPTGSKLRPGLLYHFELRNRKAAVLRLGTPLQACRSLADQPSGQPDRSPTPLILAALRVEGTAALGPFYSGNTATFRAALNVEGWRILREEKLDGLGMQLLWLPLPPDLDETTFLNRLRQRFPTVVFSMDDTFAQAGEPRRFALKAMGVRPDCSMAASTVHFGLIDTAVDWQHEALREPSIPVEEWHPESMGSMVPADHGTAITSIILNAVSISGPRLSVAAVMRDSNNKATGSGGDIILGLDWLQRRSVDIVMLALEGPYNQVMDLALLSAADRGMLMIGAAGNGGPTSGVAFPASSRWVFAISAIDAAGDIYHQASRGREVLASAPGVDIWASQAGGGGRYYSGTSFAVPYAALALAPLLEGISRDQREGLEAMRMRGRLNRLIAASATDLGEPGRDKAFGWGLLRIPACQ